MIENIFSIHHYHFIWYILGFIFAPRVTLAVLVSVYLPLSLVWKIIIWVLAFMPRGRRMYQ